MSSELLDCVEINPQSEPFWTIIWLHGLGADGHDFEPIVPQLKLPETLPIRFLFPHAPERPVTINAGMVMRAWYDVSGIPGASEVNLDEFFDSVDSLKGLIQNEIESGMPSERIVLAGFSQGGAIALHTGLQYHKNLAGLLALSTYLPQANHMVNRAKPANQAIPIMMAHGTMDPIIPISNALRTRDALSRAGYPVSWHEYPMMHAVCEEEIHDIRAWLLKIFQIGDNPIIENEEAIISTS